MFFWRAPLTAPAIDKTLSEKTQALREGRDAAVRDAKQMFAEMDARIKDREESNRQFNLFMRRIEQAERKQARRAAARKVGYRPARVMA